MYQLAVRTVLNVVQLLGFGSVRCRFRSPRDESTSLGDDFSGKETADGVAIT